MRSASGDVPGIFSSLPGFLIFWFIPSQSSVLRKWAALRSALTKPLSR